MTTSKTYSPFASVSVFSPSGALLDTAAFERGLLSLQTCGLEATVLPSARSREYRFAGADEQRIGDLVAACSQTTPSVLMASRGGYGLSRLLNQLDLSTLLTDLHQHAHVLCGHSDVTALQLALLAEHVKQAEAKENSFLPLMLHGPMVCFDFGPEEGVAPETLQHFQRAVRENRVEVEWCSVRSQPELPQGLCITGPAWGGNLLMLTSLLGTNFFPEVQNGILILEDVNEPVYKIERMLLQLLHAGVLERQVAVVLGSFSEPAPIEHDAGYDLACAVRYVQEKVKTPILMDFPFGHCRPKACWFQGRESVLRVLGPSPGANVGLRCQFEQRNE